MLNYTNFFEKTPTVVLNIPGKIVIENKGNNSLNFEVDYNAFPKEVLEKIKYGREEVFAETTNCVTYDEDKNKQKYLMVMINNDGKKEWYKALSENNTMNFSMIRNKVDILKNNIVIKSINVSYAKQFAFSLGDGNYIFRVSTYNIEGDLVFTNDIIVELKTNYYSLNSTKSENIRIPFDKKEGNFELILATNSKKLYGFKVVDIISENDNIFEFSYYNSNGYSKNISGKIGSEFDLINERQTEEIIKNPIQEKLVKPSFVFDIKELFTTKHSDDDIGVIKFATIRDKIKDTYFSYCNLKCDVTQNYTVDFPKTDDLLITDKFKNYPLFYKFLIDIPFENLKIIDSDNIEITDFITEKISENINIIYFNPLRNKEYYYILDNNPPLLIQYKKTIDSYKMVFDKNEIKLENPVYFGDLMLKGNGTYEVEIQFADYNIKTFELKATDKKFEYLEDERVKINKELISISVKTKEPVEIINMICNLKNNRYSYSYFKNNFKDFVYIANPVGKQNIDEIPDTELYKLNINKKYIFRNNILKEVENGPLYLEPIQKQDVIFTDIEEWSKEYSIDETEIVETSIDDKFFLENVINPARVIKNEN